MAVTIQLKDFTSKTTLVPADLVYSANSADSFNEVQTTVAGLIGAYPALLSIGGLTTVANQYIKTTGVDTYAAVTITATPTASQLAEWDANKNLAANSFLPGFATQATAAGTTVLTVASAEIQEFTGATTQTITLPVTSTLVAGQGFTIINSSSGALTVNSSGGNLVQTMAAGTTLFLRCILTSGTTAASWAKSYQLDSFPVSIVNGGTGVTSVTTSPTASAWAGWDANSNLSAHSFVPGLTVTATAGGTTTLTVASNYAQEFTGATTQTLVMPVTSTLQLGQGFYVMNNSTGALTVNSSGGNLIQTMASGTSAFLTCVLTSGTTAASWNVTYIVDAGGGVSPGTQNNIAWYSATGNIVSGLSTANNSVLSADGSGVPSFTTTLPNMNIGTPTAGVLTNCTGVVHAVSVQVFTGNSTYTPSAGTIYCDVYVTAGGGGGGGAQAGTAPQAAAGGGGGAGSTSILYGVAVATITGQTITVGAGGNGGTAGNNAGSTGNASSVGAVITTNGGGGGTGGQSATAAGYPRLGGGGGSAGSGGSVNIPGGAGQFGVSNGVSTVLCSGSGGASFWGGGALGTNTSAAGNNASVYGSGGSGAGATATTDRAGGNGGSGIVVIFEYK